MCRGRAPRGGIASADGSDGRANAHACEGTLCMKKTSKGLPVVQAARTDAGRIRAPAVGFIQVEVDGGARASEGRQTGAGRSGRSDGSCGAGDGGCRGTTAGTGTGGNASDRCSLQYGHSEAELADGASLAGASASSSAMRTILVPIPLQTCTQVPPEAWDNGASMGARTPHSSASASSHAHDLHDLRMAGWRAMRECRRMASGGWRVPDQCFIAAPGAGWAVALSARTGAATCTVSRLPSRLSNTRFSGTVSPSLTC